MVKLKSQYKRTTLKDVAKQAGVAASTASEILNGKKKFTSQAVCEKVLRVARELNYEKNIGYSIMVGEKVNIVGIIFSQQRLIYKEEYNNMLLFLSHGLKEKYNCAIFTEIMGSDKKENIKTISKLINTGCSSFILCGEPVGGNEIYKLLQDRKNIDYISYKFDLCDKNISIDINYVLSEYCAYLLKKEKSKFRVCMAASHLKLFRPCWHDQLPDLSETDIKMDYEFIIPEIEFHNYDCSDEMFKIGYDTAREIIRKWPETQGLIFLGDGYAVGAGRYLLENGRKDVAVFGNGNISLTRYSLFPITSSEFNVFQISQQLINKLYNCKSLKIDIKPKIIWRHKIRH